MKKKKKIIYAVTLLFFISGAGAWYAYQEYNRTNTDLTTIAAAYTLSVDEIIQEFITDEKKSDLKYSGKTLSIAGSVKSLDKDEKGFFTIVLGDTLSMNAVRCSMDSIHNKDAGVLNKGDHISVKGNCTGFNADEMGLGSDIILNRCIIEKK